MKYPVIAILNRDKNIYCFDRDHAEVCSSDLVNIFEKAIFFDSNLTKHTIHNAEKVSWAYFFGYHPLLKGRSIKIKFNIKHSELVSISDIKDKLISRLEMGVEKGFWYSKKDIPSLKDKVRKSKDFQSLVKVFNEDV